MAKFRMQIRNESESAKDENEPTEELVDTKSKAIDLTNLRVTELPFCKRIYIPDQIDTKMEVKIQSLKEKFVEKAREYINKCLMGRPYIISAGDNFVSRHGVFL
jgi:hypothetical protein